MTMPPVFRSLSDVLTLDDLARLVTQTCERRDQTFWWTTYSFGWLLPAG